MDKNENLISGDWSREKLPILLTSLLLFAGCGRPGNGDSPTISGRIAVQTDRVDVVADQARGIAAAKLGVPQESVRLGSPQVVSLPLTGKGPIVRYKAYSNKSKEVEIALDINQQEVNGESLIKVETDAWTAAHGKKAIELEQKLSTLSSADKARVSIWLHVPEEDIQTVERGPLGDGLSDAINKNKSAAEGLIGAAVSARSASTARVNARFLSRLRKLDFAAENIDHEPFFIASLTAAEVGLVEQDPDVDSLDLADRTPERQMNNAGNVLGSNAVHSWPSLDGTGIKLGMVEQNGIIYPSSYLTNYFQAYQSPTACYGDGHATAVAGIMKSNDSTYTGVAPGASLYAGGKCDTSMADVESGTTAMITWGATGVNLSLGVTSTPVGSHPTNDDKFFDSKVYSNYLPIVVSAGNSTDNTNQSCWRSNFGTTGMVMTPSLGYNVITVGATDAYDWNTNDYPNMWPCSAWKNPGSTNGDRNKPDLVAPGGGNLNILYGSSFANTVPGGTSLAAPFVTGSIALLQQAQWGLITSPEAIKAILLAASYHFPNASDPDHYGAGRLDIEAAVYLSDGIGGNWRGDVLPACNGSWPWSWPMYLYQGQRTRVAMVWRQNPNYSSYANQPDADLDLRLLDPNGNEFGVIGNSWDNTQELVDFVAPMTGTYTALASNYRCSSNPGYVGLAWYQVP